MTAPDTGQGPATVAVGYDGSEAAQDAVRWAAEYAAAGNYRIRVVHAWVWPMFTKKLGPVKGVEGSGLRHSAEAILAEGVELARTSLAAARTAAPSTPTAQSVQTDATTSPPAGVTAAGEAPGDAGTDSDVEGVMEAGLPAPVLRGCGRRRPPPGGQQPRTRGCAGACCRVGLPRPGRVLALPVDGDPPPARPRAGRGPRGGWHRRDVPELRGAGRCRPACHDDRGAPADRPHRQGLRQDP